jgi:glycosyltransferase involved in cell wall biosynthesis
MNPIDSSEIQTLAIIPAYNEEAGISDVVAGVQAYLPMLVVDDGSSDNTASLAESTGASVLRQAPNQGKGAALKAGFRWALERGYSAAITLDADGQHDPGELPKFLMICSEQGADLVIGQRDFSHMPPARQLANWLGRISFSWAVGTPIPDNQSGYRLISKRLMEAMLESRESGFEYEVEMITICLRRGFALTWVPIRTIYAGETSHIRPWQHVKNFLRILRKTRWG